MLKKIIILVVIVSFIGLVFLVRKLTSSKEEVKEKTSASNYSSLISNIEGFVTKFSKVDEAIELSGSIIPFEETTLVSEIAGKVTNLNLQEGKFVNKGTLLVKLFDEDLQAQLRKLEIQLQIASNTENRLKKLLNINGVSQQDYDNALLQMNNIKAEIEILKVNISKTEIRAPYNGVIGLKKISIGQYITPAITIATIRAINNLKLDFSIPEKYASLVGQGKEVEFYVNGNDKKFTANIIANETNVESDTQNLKVRALVKSNVKDLIPGTFAKVKINLSSNNKLIMIPTSAIIPMARDKKVYVSNNGKAKLVVVKTGIRQSDKIEIVNGLNIGDTIVTTGLLFIKPNSALKFSKVN